MKNQFGFLFQSFQLGPLELRNRLVMPAMCTNLASNDGYVTERLQDHYEARARGGVGLIIVEASSIDSPVSDGVKNHILVDDDKFIPGLSKLSNVIHCHGALTALQIVHAGAAANYVQSGIQLVAPSPINRPGALCPRELTVSEISHIVQRFADAAVRAEKANFDAVEIHAAHGYLLAEFLSSYFNRRRDKYGGSLEKRARILIEVIEAVKARVSSSFGVWIRLNGQEFGPQAGLTANEAQQVAKMAQEAGVDAVNVSLASTEINIAAGAPTAQPPGKLVFLAESIKSAISVPVMTMGRHDAVTGEKALSEGKADLVVIGRRLLADPEYPNKINTGRLDEIRPCIGCMTCLDCVVTRHVPVMCVVNPAVGQDKAMNISKASSTKKIMVAGGGPAGMESALTAAMQGHEVTLYEKSGKLGGQLLLAAIPPYKKVLGEFNAYLVSQLKKQSVNIKLGIEVDLEVIERTRPDAIIVATGAIPTQPQIPGINYDNVVFATDVLAGKAQIGEKVAVLGGEMVGCETAEFLAKQGKTVTIIEVLDELATKVNSKCREHLLARLADGEIDTYTCVQDECIDENGFIFTTKEGDAYRFEVDTVVVATGFKPETALAEALKGKEFEFYQIGDCVEPRNIMAAVREGREAALKI